ncbi:MAG: hypothetical protein IT515_15970 [Burkholderiales bacterium]|nr:hypothetical protein [Burkholderiales bacterium]
MSDQGTPPDPLELLKRMWAPLSLPVSGMVVPLASASEVQKRIADLRSVENWLTLNLNIVKMSIQGLEMQHATLSALQAAQESLGRAGSGAPRQKAADQASLRETKAGAGAETGKAGAPEAPQNPLEAWWALLQQVQRPDESGSPPQSRAEEEPKARPPGAAGKRSR